MVQVGKKGISKDRVAEAMGLGVGLAASGSTDSRRELGGAQAPFRGP